MQSQMGQTSKKQIQDASETSLISTQLAADLKDRIIHWEYAAGQRLTEDELCQQFGVSRSPVREALRILEANGFIEKVPYTGYRVLQPDIREIDELYRVRLALELHVVESLASQGLPNEDYEELSAIWSAPPKGFIRRGSGLEG